ncbi:MAG: monophosphatase [Actinomycetota bacterium]|nr:monophosphatase [Actinomycetota bacterium]
MSEFLDIATEAARRAGSLLLEKFVGPARGVDTKTSPTDPVSDADRASEELILALLAQRRPNDGVVGEEGGGRSGSSGVEWVVDPLDGTVNFLYRIPVWAVSIAARDERGTFVGVVFDPNRDEMFTAELGEGARLNSEEIHVSQETDISKALVGTGFAYQSEARAAQAKVAQRVLPRVRDLRRAGSAASDLATVACGRYDGFYEAHLEEWDRAAGVLLVQEAGGRVQDIPPPIPTIKGGVVAANPALFDALHELVVS